MIQGFQIEVTAEELVAHLEGRIRHHHGYAARKVDQYAAQKVGHWEGGLFYVVLT